MRSYGILLAITLLSIAKLPAQTAGLVQSGPAEKDFAGILTFLSSDWMEGREAGARGGFMASDYIASMMQLYGLVPDGDGDTFDPGISNRPSGKSDISKTYFQNFNVVRLKTVKATIALVGRTPDSESEFHLSDSIDFEVKAAPVTMEAEASLVFAGYGISDPARGYDDYKGLRVKDRIVVVMDGFPGHGDTTSMAWKKMGTIYGDGRLSMEDKLHTAAMHGAIALVVVSAEGAFEPYSGLQRNLAAAQSATNRRKTADPPYVDQEYVLPGDTTVSGVPIIILGSGAMNQVFSGTGIVLSDVEKRAACELSCASALLPEKRLKLAIEVSAEPLAVRNVLGMIRGKDITKSIVIGAHYDHLGVRDGKIYNGSDDNASGTAGMLALARFWSECGESPACNIIFAAWTAEEKGLLGSSYFVKHNQANPGKIILAINMDMISRSAPEDTARRILSIGTLPAGNRLKNIATDCNRRLQHPFILDLWDVTGHTGSDYGSFITKNIPVMTFFSGFHDDYHSPRDVAAKADFDKMGDVIILVNECVQEFTGTPTSE